MQVDEAGQDQQARDVHRVHGLGAGQVDRDVDDPAPSDADVGDPVPSRARVDDPSTVEQKVPHTHHPHGVASCATLLLHCQQIE